jgi:hypothetical protein
MPGLFKVRNLDSRLAVSRPGIARFHTRYQTTVGFSIIGVQPHNIKSVNRTGSK